MKINKTTLLILCLLLNVSSASYAIHSDLVTGAVTGTYERWSHDLGIVTDNPYRGENDGLRSIPTYVIDNTLYILAEDLVFYGFEMSWNPQKRETHISMPDQGKAEVKSFHQVPESGNTLSSDIKIFLQGEQIQGHNIGGYTLIRVADIDSPNLYFVRTEGLETVTGSIGLPQGKIAQEDIYISVFLLKHDGRSQAEKYNSRAFKIQKGTNSIPYTFNLKDYLQNDFALYMNYVPRLYIGFEVLDASDMYHELRVSKDQSPDDLDLFIQPLNMDTATYKSMDYTLLEKADLTLKTKFSGDIFDIYDTSPEGLDLGEMGVKRGVQYTFRDMDLNKSYTVKSLIDLNTQDAEQTVQLIKDHRYEVSVQLKSLGSIPVQEMRPPSPYFESVLYCDLLLLENDLEIDQVIELPSISAGKVYAGIKSYEYQGASLPTYVTRDATYVSAHDVGGLSYETRLLYNAETPQSMSESNSVSRLKELGYLVKSNKRSTLSAANQTDDSVPLYEIVYNSDVSQQENQAVGHLFINIKDLIQLENLLQIGDGQ